jgi:hypothetical protein
VLAPGRYEIAGTLKVDKSGVVLRGSGEGEDPPSATPCQSARQQFRAVPCARDDKP